MWWLAQGPKPASGFKLSVILEVWFTITTPLCILGTPKEVWKKVLRDPHCAGI